MTIKDKVVERLAVKAALDTDGVLARSEGFGKLTGRDLPRVRVLISGGRVRAGVDIAALWPTPLPALTASVRDNVARALSSLAGLHVDGVDVTVPFTPGRMDASQDVTVPAIIVDPTPAGVTSGGSAIT